MPHIFNTYSGIFKSTFTQLPIKYQYDINFDLEDNAF